MPKFLLLVILICLILAGLSWLWFFSAMQPSTAIQAVQVELLRGTGRIENTTNPTTNLRNSRTIFPVERVLVVDLNSLIVLHMPDGQIIPLQTGSFRLQKPILENGKTSYTFQELDSGYRYQYILDNQRQTAPATIFGILPLPTDFSPELPQVLGVRDRVLTPGEVQELDNIGLCITKQNNKAVQLNITLISCASSSVSI